MTCVKELCAKELCVRVEEGAVRVKKLCAKVRHVEGMCVKEKVLRSRNMNEKYVLTTGRRCKWLQTWLKRSLESKREQAMLDPRSSPGFKFKSRCSPETTAPPEPAQCRKCHPGHAK